ncbi:NAD(P)/FAD-dependent oxidoreductase [Spirochaeta africana]|uniref:Putative dehydrogenase n=1 Tax=Spirochaeta africana (strain ATCC 700263 / DSM 8902 / Z-7692) TaxID=889378 RepID=H9UI09_SPIAZ|nr:NAD(P)/FAD-dependent oxidoreductase [Spirochaeta africana]AFG37152.1 putative dehydrogenase [Spirochaeta africana DSM 8902]
MKYDIAIIGAGVIGSAIARELSMYDVQVLLLEKGNDVSLGASKANSGIVHGGYDARHGTLKSRLSYPGNQRFAQWEQELGFGYEKRGSLVLAFSQEQREQLAHLKQNGELNGVPDLRIIERNEILDLEPNCNPEVQAALHAPHVGICSPYELTIALAENAIANGVDLRLMSAVVRIEVTPQGYHLHTREGRVYQARRVINAAGVHAGEIARLMGITDIRIDPRKGQYLVFRKGTGDMVRQVLFQVPSAAGKGVLVTSTYHGNLMIGPNAQDADSPEDLDTDAETLKKVLATAQQSLPGCTASEYIRSYSGIRATSSTRDFIIRREDHLPGCIQVAGIDSPGLTAAPMIADMVLDLLREDGLALQPDSQAARTRRRIIERVPWSEMLPMKEANELTKLPPGNPERVVCRCEQVREATIRDSLHRGILVTSTDGVKRRTRAGMGMCQGKFCGPRVTALIAGEYGLNEQDVTQRGPGSGVDPRRVLRGEL